MSHSSTSSSDPGRSRGWRAWELWITCGLALLAVFAIDHAVFSRPETWAVLTERLVGRSDGFCGIEEGKARAMHALTSLASSDSGKGRALVIGSSRACVGWWPEDVPDLGADDPRKRMGFAKVAFAALGPYAMRTLSTRVEEVDQVVIYLSEFDTHRAPFLLANAGFGGVRAFAEFVPNAGFDYWWDRRSMFLQLFAAAILDGYRHRDVLLQAVTQDLRRFPLEDRLPATSNELRYLSVDSHLSDFLTEEEFDRIVENVGDSSQHPIPLGEFHQLRAITRGAHVESQAKILENTIREFVEKGAEILVVEAPLSPLGDPLYDLTIRDDFVRMVADLQRRYPVDFLSRESLPPRDSKDFPDLTHVSYSAAKEITRAILRRLGS